MVFFHMLKNNLKRLLRQKPVMLMTFILPLAVLIIVSLIVGGGKEVSYIYFINNDKGSISEEYINELKENNNIKISEEDDAVNKVKNKIINCAYEIPENFSEEIKSGNVPEINIISIEDSNLGSFEYESTEVLNNIILKEYMGNKGIDIAYEDLKSNSSVNVQEDGNSDMTDRILLNILISFIFFACISVGTELYSLKEQKILKRSFISGNSEKKILASILSALFIIYSVCYSVVFSIQAFIRKSEMISKFPYIIANIICLSFVSICLGMLLVRICKKESTIPLWGQGFSWITCFVGGSFMPLELLPERIKVFSKFTPQYWALESIKSENLYLCFIVILFGIVFFTAGTLKFKKMIMN